MKIGLYFGSFNPIHHGHLLVAKYLLDNSNLEQIWFVVSPQNPLKPSSTLLNEYHRLYLVQLAVEGENGFRASDVEFRLPKPSYTVDTLAFLSEKYPQHEFALIMGSDSLQNLAKWKNYQTILTRFPIYVYKRDGFPDNPFAENKTVEFVNAPLLPISATTIRALLKQGKSIRYYVPDKVREEIERNNYYK